MNEVLGVIAGSGQFPFMVVKGAREKGYKVIVCGFHGHTDSNLGDIADHFEMMPLGQFNRLIRFFRRAGVIELCMAGAINKPRALQVRPDFRAFRLYFSLCRKGDDSLFRTIIKEFEREGFLMVSPSIFVPFLHCPPGILSDKQPDKDILAEIGYGWPIATSLGRFDIGQLIVVKQQMVIAIECLEGTNATLQRGAELGGKNCVAIKIAKPMQDERVDLPTIGLETIDLLVKYQFKCIAVSAEKTLFFDMPEALKLANKHKLCVMSLFDKDIKQIYNKL